MLLITHDMGVVAGLAQRIVILYAGCVVETGTTDEIFYQPTHPTPGACKGLPRLDEMGGGRLHTIEGTPRADRTGPGCPFAPRCPTPRSSAAGKYPPCGIWAVAIWWAAPRRAGGDRVSQPILQVGT